MSRVLAVALIAQVFSVASNRISELRRVERLTADESAALHIAEAALAKANKVVDQEKKKIAAAHRMNAENWMEWQTSVEFDGEFILLRYTSFMSLVALPPCAPDAGPSTIGCSPP